MNRTLAKRLDALEQATPREPPVKCGTIIFADGETKEIYSNKNGAIGVLDANARFISGNNPPVKIQDYRTWEKYPAWDVLKQLLETETR